MTHDAYHCGEIALTLGSHGIAGDLPNGPIDLWSGLAHRTVSAAAVSPPAAPS